MITKDCLQKALKIAIPPQESPPLENGEENLAPSTEKKQGCVIPQAVKTGTHLGANGQQKNIFLNKFQCNSTRNSQSNNRYKEQNFNFKSNAPDRNSSEGPPSEKSAFNKKLGARSGSESNILPKSEKVMNIQPAHKIIIPNDDPTKTSNKRTGIVRGYAANTN